MHFNAIRVALLSSVCALGIGGIFGSRTNATPIDVLAGLQWTSTTTSNFGSSNSTRELTFTDGATNPTSNSNAGTYEFIGYSDGATVIYDLGSSQQTDLFGIWAGLNNNRGGPKNVTIDRSNSSTFSSIVATDNVVLASYIDGTQTGAYYQTASITDATARYVRFTFPGGDENYYLHTVGGSGHATLSELQLFQTVPEPTSLGLLAVSGVVLMRRRQVSGR